MKAMKAFFVVALILTVIVLTREGDRPASSSALDAGLRTHRLQQCIGTAPSDMSFTEWATELSNRSARAGVSTDTYQALAWKMAENKNPGVTKRCEAR